MAKQTEAKTPTVAIARVLRGLGLKQGIDFRVTGKYEGTGADRYRLGTHVVVLTGAAEERVSIHRDTIEHRVAEEGFAFKVSIHTAPGGRFWSWIANYGTRVREDEPVVTAEDRTVPKLKAATARPAFENAAEAKGIPAADAHPYDGAVAQQWFGGRQWACEVSGEVWFFQNTLNSPRWTLIRKGGRGWFLTGPGLPLAGQRMGSSVGAAAYVTGKYLDEIGY